MACPGIDWVKTEFGVCVLTPVLNENVLLGGRVVGLMGRGVESWSVLLNGFTALDVLCCVPITAKLVCGGNVTDFGCDNGL